MVREPAAGNLPSLAAVALLALGVSCSGSPFELGDAPCSGSGCGGESGTEPGGAAGELGEPSPPASGAGGSVGSGIGGVSIAGKAGTGGTAGVPGISGSGGSTGEAPRFPATGLLDDFDREGPGLGGSWVGAANDYSIVEQALWCQYCGGATLWDEVFGSEQEVYATLRAFDTNAGEMNLVLRAQEHVHCELIEVLYSPVEETVRVAYCSESVWTDLPEKELALQPGARFGGRALANGQLEIYVDQQLFATYDVSGFPYSSGKIGANGVSGGTGLSWDDFGGGNWR